MPIPAYILELSKLTGVDPAQIIHFVTGRQDDGDVAITVRTGRCIVLQSITQTDVDTDAPRTIQVASGGIAQGVETDVELYAGTDVMRLFPRGEHVFTLTLTPAAGKVAHTQFSYFELPDSAAEVLKSIATRQVMQA